MSRECNQFQLVVAVAGPNPARPPKRHVKRTVRVPAAALLVAAVTVATLLPAGTAGPVPTGSVEVPWLGLGIGVDKLAHALGFGVITVATARLAADRRELLAVVLFGLALGAATELAQSGVPGRTPDVFDFLADAVGVAVGTVVHVLWTETE